MSLKTIGKEILTADYESRVRELEEDLKMQAQSYDANSKGWQKDIEELKKHIKVLEDTLKEIRGMSAMIGASNISNACKRALRHRATLEVK